MEISTRAQNSYEQSEFILSLDKKIKSSKLLLFLIGGSVLVVGITLVLVWWQVVVVLFRGGVGLVLALGGLLLLYMMKE